MEKNDCVGCYIYSISRAWSSMNPVTLVQSWRKLLPDLEDDLQSFPNEEIGKSKILDMVCTMRSFENFNEDNIKEWLQSDVCELGFQHMTRTLLMLPRNKREKKRVGRMRVKNDKVVSAPVIAWHYSVLTLLEYMDQRGFEYSDITAARKTCAARSLSNSQKQATITHYFSK
jgi:hypothetical protein